MAEDTDVISLAVEIVSAFVGHNNIRPDDVPAFIASTHAAILALGESAAPVAEEPAEDAPKGMVSARKSLASKDHIVSMIDGKPYKTLRRHLSTHGMTPESYRTRFKLPVSYPMVAETYSATRRELARKIGLGRKPAAPVEAEPAEAPSPAPAKRGRKPRAAAPDAPAPVPAKRGRKPKVAAAD